MALKGTANSIPQTESKCALKIQPMWSTRPQASNTNPEGLQKKLRFLLLVHRALGVHGFNKDSQTMKCHVCTGVILSCSNNYTYKGGGGSYLVQYLAFSTDKTTKK